MQPIIIQIDKPIKDLHAMEHDINTRFPIFQFKSGMKSIDLTSHTVRVYGKNHQLNTFFNDLEIVNAKQGIARLELTDTMLVKGTTKMQFVIMPNAGGELKTRIFNLINGESLVDSNALEGSNEYKVFENALKKIDGYEGRLTAVEGESKQNKEGLVSANNEVEGLKIKTQNNATEITELQRLMNEANSKITILESLKNSLIVTGNANKGSTQIKMADGKTWVHEYGIYNTASGGGVALSVINDIRAISATCQATTAQSVGVNVESPNTIRFYHSYTGSLNIRWNVWGYK